jgi:integrase
VAQSQKLTKGMCTSAAPVSAEDGKGRERVLWDAGDGSVKGFGLRVSAKGARSFIVMYRAGRGRAAPLRKVTIGPFGSPWTVETARTEAKRLLSEVAAGRDPAGAKAEKRSEQKAGVAAKDSVRAAVDEWIKRDQADNRTVDEVRSRMKREIIPLWGDRALTSIRKKDVIELVDGIADRGTRLAANRTLASVRRFLSWAAARDMIDSNPAQFVEKPAPETRRDRTLDDRELVEIWRALEGMCEPFAAGVRLLVLTACRRTEVFAARKDELVPGGIRLPAERSKNAEGRLIHLSPPAQAIIDGLTVWPDCPYLLTTDGAHPFSGYSKAKTELNLRIAAARGRAEPMSGWWLHDVRRSAASGMQRLGVRLEVIEAVLGHVSGSRAGIVGTYQRYRFEAEAAAALELWGEHVMRLLDPTPAKVVQMMRRQGA